MTNQIACIFKHVGNTSEPPKQFEGTVESVLKQIMLEIASKTLYTRMDMSIARTLDEAKVAFEKTGRKTKTPVDDEEFFAELTRIAMESAEASGDQE